MLILIFWIILSYLIVLDRFFILCAEKPMRFYLGTHNFIILIMVDLAKYSSQRLMQANEK